MAENIVESFTEYWDCLKDEYQPHLLYRGEFLARHLYSTIEETNNWIVWENKGGIEICKVNKQDNYIFISAIYCLPNPFFQNDITNKVFCNDNCRTWLNLCHFMDSNGSVHYDSYYDTLPALDSSIDFPLSVGELRNALSEIIKTQFPFKKGDKVFLYNRIGSFNILLDILVKNGISLFTGFKIDENIIRDDYIPTSLPLNLYMVTKEVNVVLPMPEDKDILVHDHIENLYSEEYNCQIQHTNSDMMGNRWMSITLPDGARQSTLYIKSSIECKTNIFEN